MANQVLRELLRKFVKSRMPMIVHVLRTLESDSNEDRKRGAKYSFKHGFFYPAVNYIDIAPMASRAALKKFSTLNTKPINRDLRSFIGSEQSVFDKRSTKKKRKFHLDHVFTGEMCLRALDKMYKKNALSAQSVVRLLMNNYAVAWILREENSRLPRSGRGKNLRDAKRRYKQCGIPIQ